VLKQILQIRLCCFDLAGPLLQLGERLLEVRAHPIERVSELFNFIAGLDVQPMVERPGTDPLRALLQRSDWAHETASNRDAGSQEQPKDDRAVERDLRQQIIKR